MRTPLATAVAATVLLLVPGTASAKEVGRVLACGAEDCANVTGRVGGLETFDVVHASAARPPRPHRFVTIRVSLREPGQGLVDGWKWLYVPAVRIVRYGAEDGGFRWGRVTPQQAAVLDRLVRGVKPSPAQRMPVDPVPAAARSAPSAQPPVHAASTAAQGRGGRVSNAVAAGAAALVAAGALVALRRLTGRRER